MLCVIIRNDPPDGGTHANQHEKCSQNHIAASHSRQRHLEESHTLSVEKY